MFKKALVASAVLAATSGLAFANGGTVMVEPTHTCWYYLGVAISSDFVDLDASRSHFGYLTTSGVTDSNWATNWDQSLTGVNGELYLGAGWLYLDHYYLGVELFGDVSNADGDHSDFFGGPFAGNPISGATPYQENMSFRMTSNWGISGLLGYRYDRSLFYARLGWEGARFKASSGELNPSAVVLPVGYVPITFSQSNTENAFQVGLGIETLLTECLSVRAEYDWARFNDINFNVTGSPVFVSAALPATSVSQNYTFSATPTVQEVKLGLTWRFNAV